MKKITKTAYQFRQITMKKHIIRSLQIATLAVGVTATALAGAKTDKSHSWASLKIVPIFPNL